MFRECMIMICMTALLSSCSKQDINTKKYKTSKETKDISINIKDEKLKISWSVSLINKSPFKLVEKKLDKDKKEVVLIVELIRDFTVEERMDWMAIGERIGVPLECNLKNINGLNVFNSRFKFRNKMNEGKKGERFCVFVSYYKSLKESFSLIEVKPEN